MNDAQSNNRAIPLRLRLIGFWHNLIHLGPGVALHFWRMSGRTR